MKIRIRNSSLKRVRKHGFRAKPNSYLKKKHKVKTLRIVARIRRKRRTDSNK